MDGGLEAADVGVEKGDVLKHGIKVLVVGWVILDPGSSVY